MFCLVFIKLLLNKMFYKIRKYIYLFVNEVEWGKIGYIQVALIDTLFKIHFQTLPSKTNTCPQVI
jgi:hypothetical protein